MFQTWRIKYNRYCNVFTVSIPWIQRLLTKHLFAARNYIFVPERKRHELEKNTLRILEMF